MLLEQKAGRDFNYLTRQKPAKRPEVFHRHRLSPFASLLRDPETYEKFDDVIVTHTCRTLQMMNGDLRLLTLLNDRYWRNRAASCGCFQ